MAYLSDDLLPMIKRAGAVPTAQASFTSTDLLSVSDEEIQTYILPLIRRVREEFYVTITDFPLTASGAQGISGPYRIPYRAVGGALRDVQLLDANGNVIQVPRQSIDDLEQIAWGTYLQGNNVYFINKTTYATPVTLRMVWFVRPSRLVLAAAAGRVASFNATAKTVTLVAAPAAFTGQTTWDIVQARPGFDLLTYDAAGTLVGSTITFTTALPASLAVGDYVCLPEQSPIPQIPAEMHPLLAQRVACKYLQSTGELPALQAGMQMLQQMEQGVMILLTPRVEGQPRKLSPRGTPWRRFRR